MKTKILILIASLLLASTAQGQQRGFVFGKVKRQSISAEVGRLVQIKADSEVEYDDDGKPNITIEFESNDGGDTLLQHSVEPIPGTLIMPTGTKPQTVVIRLRVIDWENRSITREFITVEIGQGANPPPVEPDKPEEPDTPTPGPGKDVTKFEAECVKIITSAIESSAGKQPQIKNEARAYGVAYAAAVESVEFIEAKTLPDAVAVIRKNLQQFLLGLDKLDGNWAPAIQQMSGLINADPPTDLAEFKTYILAMSRAFTKAGT